MGNLSPLFPQAGERRGIQEWLGVGGRLHSQFSGCLPGRRGIMFWFCSMVLGQKFVGRGMEIFTSTTIATCAGGEKIAAGLSPIFSSALSVNSRVGMEVAATHPKRTILLTEEILAWLLLVFTCTRARRNVSFKCRRSYS